MSATIVIIEDNLPDVVLLREALEEHGASYELTVIGDGEAALEYVASLPPGAPLPCLLILDLNLPKRDGIEVLRGIRESAALSRVRVVVLTTSDSPSEREMVEAIGVRAYFRKPVDLDSFMALGGVLKEICQEQAVGPVRG